MTKFLTVEVSRKKYNEVNIEQYIEMQILHMLCNKHYSMYAIIHMSTTIQLVYCKLNCIFIEIHRHVFYC